METVSEAIIQRYNGHHSKRIALLALYTVSLFPMVLYCTWYSSFAGPIERQAAGIDLHGFHNTAHPRGSRNIGS